MSLVNLNNAASITNASKDRERAKLRNDEMNTLMAEFENSAKPSAKEVDETVKTEVEYALLRMTEKKIIADQQIESLRSQLDVKTKELEQKDKRILELEKLISQLGLSPTRSMLKLSHIESDFNERVELTPARTGYVDHTFAHKDKPDRQSGPSKQEEEDDSFWY